MRTLEDELRAIYPLDWQPSSMRPYGFGMFSAAWAGNRRFTVYGARAGAVLVVKVDASPVVHYLVCSSNEYGAELVTSGPDLSGALQRAAQIDAPIRGVA